MITTHWADFQRPNSSWSFLLKRVVRIFPLYWTVTLLLFAVVSAFASSIHTIDVRDTSLALSLLLLPQVQPPLLWVGWTLIFEMYFYYVFAALLRVPRRAAFAAVGVWGAMIFIAQFVPWTRSNVYVATLFSNIVIEFIFGIAVGVAHRRGLTKWAEVSIAFGAVIWLGEFLLTNRHGQSYFMYDDFRFLMVGAPMALVLYGAVSVESARGRTMPLAILAIGDASYSIYLWHSVLLVGLQKFSEKLPHVPAYLTLLVSLTIALAVSIGLYRVLEMPLVRLGRRLTVSIFPRPDGLTR